MRTFDFEDDEDGDPETEAWLEFKANGGFNVKFEDSTEYIRKAVAYLDAEDCAGGFYLKAGYESGGCLVDYWNVPANIFEELFPDDSGADWNCSEATHFFVLAKGERHQAGRERVFKTLTKAGFDVEYE